MAYNAMLNELLFLDGFNQKDFYQKRILAFLIIFLAKVQDILCVARDLFCIIIEHK